MKKVFKCEATGEEIVVQKTKNREYNETRNMSIEELTKILEWVDIQTLKSALSNVLNGKTDRLIYIAQALHGRIYDVLRKAEW
jgi:ABC-type branched-subunit amino acid transport system ATPase component